MITDTKTDKELAIQIRNGDLIAFDRIYEKYSTRLYLFIYGIIKSQKDAEDIVQEVFIKVWDKREKINELSYSFSIKFDGLQLFSKNGYSYKQKSSDKDSVIVNNLPFNKNKALRFNVESVVFKNQFIK